MYTSRSPVGSFAFGDVSVRIKFKSGVKFKVLHWWVSDCSALSDSEKNDTVIASNWDEPTGWAGTEFVICGTGPIHSWSYGTPEHYDELVKDIKWQDTHHSSDYETYYNINGAPVRYGVHLAEPPFNEKVLATDLYKHMKRALKGGEVFLSPDVRAHSTREDHFTTRHPIYYNER